MRGSANAYRSWDPWDVAEARATALLTALAYRQRTCSQKTLHAVLPGCSGCNIQTIEEMVYRYNGQDWNFLSKLYRKVRTPPDADLV